MKKYSAYALYVINVGKGDKNHYFICECKHSYSNTIYRN